MDGKVILQELGEIALTVDDSINYQMQVILERWFIKHHNKVPYQFWCNEIYFNKPLQRVGEFHLNDGVSSSFESVDQITYDDETEEEVIMQKKKEGLESIDVIKTVEKLMKAFEKEIFVFKMGMTAEDYIIFHEDFVFFNAKFYSTFEVLPEKIKKCISVKKNKNKIYWVSHDSRDGINVKPIEVKAKGNIEMNYNDDFMAVDKKINSIINQNESSLIILHGEPGTGKTSYIRDLIVHNSGVRFYWIDSSMFRFMDSTEFLNFLMGCKNGVFILEDCEVLLKSREDNTSNPMLNSVLNISDGILGDSLNLKFICTFNTNLSKIDKAILRKGRLKCKYEFKDLAKNKIAQIFKKNGINPDNATKDMPLCDIYNFQENNGMETKAKHIGFN
jgi:ATP-dependent 26S proteasome regulatory subunit